jgi:hypothetical protein
MSLSKKRSEEIMMDMSRMKVDEVFKEVQLHNPMNVQYRFTIVGSVSMLMALRLDSWAFIEEVSSHDKTLISIIQNIQKCFRETIVSYIDYHVHYCNETGRPIALAVGPSSLHQIPFRMHASDHRVKTQLVMNGDTASFFGSHRNTVDYRERDEGIIPAVNDEMWITSLDQIDIHVLLHVELIFTQRKKRAEVQALFRDELENQESEQSDE